MGQTFKPAVALAVVITCGISTIAIGGPAIILSMLEAILAISVIIFVVGWLTNAGSRLVLAAICLTILAAWVSAIFLDVTTPSALNPANLRSCILMTLLAGTFMAASFMLTGPCLKLGARLRKSPAPAAEADKAGNEDRQLRAAATLL